MFNVYNLLIYKLLVCLKNRNIESINIEDLIDVHSDFIKLFEIYNLNDYYDYFKDIKKFIMTFIYVFSYFELGIYQKKTIIFDEDSIIIDKLFNSIININDKVINEMAIILSIYLNDIKKENKLKKQLIN